MSVCYNATLMSEMEEYDYIVVGGGTAGCPLATTLSKNFRVLILERGELGYSLPTVVEEDGFYFNSLNPDD